jgi:Flp pilus assembly secretin CpaC
MTSGVAKLIAEPTLTTVSGRPAAFHVGNEFPILIPGGDNTVAVEYRQTGTRVDMVPIVTGKHRLQLEVRPSVTTLEKPSKFEFKGVESSETISSFERPVRESNEPDKRLLADIPTFVSRHVETTADMSHDGTLIVAMVDQDTQDKTKSKCLITMLRPQIMNQTRVARSISTVATPRVPMEFAPPRPDSPTVIDRTTKQR